MTAMNTTKNTIMKQLPQFSASRCKRCGICTHFCPVNAIDTCDGMPFLADSVACTSCGLCRDMCPDWAVALEATAVEAPDLEATTTAPVTGKTPRTSATADTTTALAGTPAGSSGNGAGSLKTVPAGAD